MTEVKNVDLARLARQNPIKFSTRARVMDLAHKGLGIAGGAWATIALIASDASPKYLTATALGLAMSAGFKAVAEAFSNRSLMKGFKRALADNKLDQAYLAIKDFSQSSGKYADHCMNNLLGAALEEGKDDFARTITAGIKEKTQAAHTYFSLGNDSDKFGLMEEAVRIIGRMPEN
ncbi:MAG: hypothetical protein ABIJ26_06580, partial [Candidatus Margulisiibacteriota bacterium]